MENFKTFQEGGKLKKIYLQDEDLKNLSKGWRFEKSSRKMENNNFFQKDEKI